MREIKFRAYIEKGFNYPELRGKMVYELDDELTYMRSGDLRLYGAFQGSLMQYTGLKDINEVEVYEDDIVSMHYFYESGSLNGAFEAEAEVVGVVEYRPDFAVWVVSTKERDYAISEYCQEPSEELEVLGNIYENPDLLESRKEQDGE